MIADTNSLEPVVKVVRSSQMLVSIGHGSKTALSRLPNNTTPLDMTALSGVLEYDPGEYTFTALAGTKVSEVRDLLEKNGQYLPFDPVLVDAGATLGGTVASGLSGPGRVRYGGVRDFILGVQFIDGHGNIIRGGGKVVKNAAGFDFPKLMVGSLGRLGAMTELSFKVFPKPKTFQTARFELPSFQRALEMVVQLSRSNFDLEGLEFIPSGTVLVRLGGVPEALRARMDRLEGFVGMKAVRLEGEPERTVWDGFREFSEHRSARYLLKIPVTPKRIPLLEARLEGASQRRYGAAGQVAWVAWNGDLTELESVLRELELSALVFMGETDNPILGAGPDARMLERVKRALDPDGKFPGFNS
jgi:glycolate oxidase FAD binding subunit